MSTMKQTTAAFSKSVNCNSHGLNSTRHPIGAEGGGGLKRIVCQLVDCMFSKWSTQGKECQLKCLIEYLHRSYSTCVPLVVLA